MKLIVNGAEVDIASDGDTPLLWVLRDELDLVGTKYGCGMAQCGACTVHLAGQPIRSCITPVSAAAGQAVETIEGQAAGADLTAVQRAWLETDVAQCGYCQSGQIMQAASFLDTNPEPMDDQIDAAMSGNLCRCGTYPRIRAAVKTAAKNLREV